MYKTTLFCFFAISALHGATPSKNEVGLTRDKDGALVYSSNKKGDKICDFSFAGYEAGMKELPLDVKVISRLKPLGGTKDDTEQIQAAIDKAGLAELDSTGFRGAVVLSKGTFILNGSLSLKADGVVLKGDGTTLNCKGGEMRTVLSIGGTEKVATAKKHYAVADKYLPVGSSVIHLTETKGLIEGMRIIISRCITDKWVASLGMDSLVREKSPLTWIKAGASLEIERGIVKVTADEITLDVPLCDSIDAAYFEKINVSAITATNRLKHIGVEGISFITNPVKVKTDIFDPSMSGIEILAVEDAWVRNCVLSDFMSAIACGANTRRVTLQDNRITRSSAIPGNAKPFDIQIVGSQILVRGGSSLSTKTVAFAVATMGSSSTFGPNAIINYKLGNENSGIQPHMRWGATGLLVQNVTGGDGVKIINRENMGTGHGWTGAHCVVWNCNCPVVTQSPPGYQNFVFGGKRPTGNGTFLPAQNFDLYEAQLAERKKAACSN